MPRKRQANTERQRILFSYNADLDKPIGVVFEYLIQNEQIPARLGKHKGLEAMSAFWQPFAYQAMKDLSEDELQGMARESVAALSRQIDLICQTFGIESPQSAQVSPELKQAIQQTMGEVLQQFIVTGVLASQDGGQQISAEEQAEVSQAMPQENGIKFDEATALGELLDESETVA
ncbi:MAG: hypothetical protein F6K11_21480 [Leptolyngbya sp. SIO3F4]|nr:hypothetical protein [Leptolyngbya sp. SIO3F4]